LRISRSATVPGRNRFFFPACASSGRTPGGRPGDKTHTTLQHMPIPISLRKTPSNVRPPALPPALPDPDAPARCRGSGTLCRPAGRLGAGGGELLSCSLELGSGGGGRRRALVLPPALVLAPEGRLRWAVWAIVKLSRCCRVVDAYQRYRMLFKKEVSQGEGMSSLVACTISKRWMSASRSKGTAKGVACGARRPIGRGLNMACLSRTTRRARVRWAK
jgi:hypothetical protein